MSTEKRDRLATSAAMWVPSAGNNLNDALRFISEKKYEDAVRVIEAARAELERLAPLYEEACSEASG